MKVSCGATLEFTTSRCKIHVCTVPVLIIPGTVDSETHPAEKHKCKCGVTWTNNSALASEGKTWSQEIDITPGRSTPKTNDNEGNQEEPDKPN
jgi:hypothetical protein